MSDQTISDGFGNVWPLHCDVEPGCDGINQVVRPGKYQCSKEHSHGAAQPTGEATQPEGTLQWKPQVDPRQETYAKDIWEFAVGWHQTRYFRLPPAQREQDVPMLTKFGEALLAERVSSPRSAEADFKYGGAFSFRSWLQMHTNLFSYKLNQVVDAHEAFVNAALPGQPSPAPELQPCKPNSIMKQVMWCDTHNRSHSECKNELEMRPSHPSKGLEQVEHPGISLATRIVLAAHKAFEEAVLHKDPVFRFSEADIESYLQAVPARKEESAK